MKGLSQAFKSILHSYENHCIKQEITLQNIKSKKLILLKFYYALQALCGNFKWEEKKTEEGRDITALNSKPSSLPENEVMKQRLIKKQNLFTVLMGNTTNIVPVK
jgi:hypothetical protein